MTEFSPLFVNQIGGGTDQSLRKPVTGSVGGLGPIVPILRLSPSHSGTGLEIMERSACFE